MFVKNHFPQKPSQSEAWRKQIPQKTVVTSDGGAPPISRNFILMLINKKSKLFWFAINVKVHWKQICLIQPVKLFFNSPLYLVASSYLIAGKKSGLRSNKKLRHALLSRPTASSPTPPPPPSAAAKYVFSKPNFFFLARLIKRLPPSFPHQSPSLLTSGGSRSLLLLLSCGGRRTTKKLDSIENRDLFQLKIKICGQTSFQSERPARDTKPLFIENHFFARSTKVKVFVIGKVEKCWCDHILLFSRGNGA